MIKIFAEDADKQTLLDWQETNQASISVDATNDAAGLNLTTFPCVVEIEGSTVVKTYAEGMDSILNLTSEVVAEIIAKSN